MSFKTIDHCDIERLTNKSYTSLSGYIDVSYDNLCRVFGKPTVIHDPHGKTDVEWTLLIDDEVVATIYNYKDGFNYLGSSGWQKEDITDWHIGGQGKGEVALVLREYEEGMKQWRSDRCETL
jgi:hypothetical protein